MSKQEILSITREHYLRLEGLEKENKQLKEDCDTFAKALERREGEIKQLDEDCEIFARTLEHRDSRIENLKGKTMRKTTLYDERKSWDHAERMEKSEEEQRQLNIEEQKVKNRKLELENMEKEGNLGIEKGK